MSRKMLSLDMEDKIAKEYESGLSLRQVASKLRISKTAVQRVVENRGIMRALNGRDPKTRPYRPGSIMSIGPQLRKEYEEDLRVTVYTLAERYDCSISAIHRSLIAAGTEMRQAGGDKRSRQKRGLLGWINS